MSKATSNLLLIFIKNPVKGHVKTRLAASVGEEEALQIYRKLLRHTRQVALQADVDREVWYSQSIDREDMWDEVNFSKHLQQGGDLGARMRHAFEQGFAKGYKKIVIIGSDCGELAAGDLQAAFEQLDTNGVVIGPASDGGYYLLGLDQFRPELFEKKSWSTKEVLAQTIRNCRDNTYQYSLLPERNDVDTEADWNQLSGTK